MTNINLRDVSIECIENAFDEMVKKGEGPVEILLQIKDSMLRIRNMPNPPKNPLDEGMIGYIFERGDDFIKFNYLTGENEYSSKEIEALWLDYIQKEENDECGPYGDYIAEEDIRLIEGFKGRRLYEVL